MNLVFYRKLSFGVILASFVCLPFLNQAQSVRRQCISSYGGGVSSENIGIYQTGGQSYSTSSSSANGFTILPGFQQPVSFKIENIISENLSRLNLTVFPNPAVYSLSIKSSEVIENARIQVLDIQGKVMLSNTVSQLQNYKIDCETWVNGTYFINVSDGNQNKSSLKLIIEK